MPPRPMQLMRYGCWKCWTRFTPPLPADTRSTLAEARLCVDRTERSPRWWCGGLIDRFGPRRVVLAAMTVNVCGLALLLLVTDLWQLHLFWGVLVGLGTGAIGGTLGATVAVRWFRTNRGLVQGLFGGASSAGQLIFLPFLMFLTVLMGWRNAVLLTVGVAALLLLPIVFFLRDRPEQMGLKPYGEGQTITAAERDEDTRITPLVDAVRTRDFWLLAGSFFVCGYTSTGLIGTHLIPHAVEHGFTTQAAASALGVIGLMNVVGTTGSGWLTDRVDPRKLAAYGGGFFHDVLGDYHLMFISAALLGFVAAGLSLGISPVRRLQAVPVAA